MMSDRSLMLDLISLTDILEASSIWSNSSLVSALTRYNWLSLKSYYGGQFRTRGLICSFPFTTFYVSSLITTHFNK
jgi:hypothetical protein